MRVVDSHASDLQHGSLPGFIPFRTSVVHPCNTLQMELYQYCDLLARAAMPDDAWKTGSDEQ